MTTAKNTNKTIKLELGYINENKIKALFSEYTETENDNGYFLQVQGNQRHGVSIFTNCFESKKHLKKHLFSRLLLAI